MASQLVVAVLLVVAPACLNGELPLAAETDSLLQPVGRGLAPAAEPLTKSKTVRCFKQNVLQDDGRNYEIEHIRKDEEVVESVQRSGRDLRLAADAAVPPGCVVVTSVRQDEGDVGGGNGLHHGMTVAHFPEYPQYGVSGGGGSAGGGGGVGGGGGGLHVGDVVLPQLPYPVKGVSLSGGVGGVTGVGGSSSGGGFEYGGGGGEQPAGGYGYGTGGGGDNFVNFKDVSGVPAGPPPQQHDGAGGGGADDVVRTYQVSTNLRRQESFDHHASGVERGKAGAGFPFGFGGSGGGSGHFAGTKYETSANDLDQVVSGADGGLHAALAGLLLCAGALLLAL